jgi:hypothetical protein
MSREGGKEMSDYVYKPGDEVPQETPWAREVRLRLYQRSLGQTDVVRFLMNHGIMEDRVTISQMLRGVGTRGHMESIRAINAFLGIPSANSQANQAEKM